MRRRGPGRSRLDRLELARYMLKSMRCLNFAAVAALLYAEPDATRNAFPAATCCISRRDAGRGPALAVELGDGFQNPAAIGLPRRRPEYRGTAVALNTGTDRGVSAQLAAVAVGLPQRITVGFSAARAAINGIGHTIADPAAHRARHSVQHARAVADRGAPLARARHVGRRRFATAPARWTACGDRRSGSTAA